MEYEFKGTAFTVKNFPSDVAGNEKFPGAGERTIYAATASNGPWFEGGFPIIKTTALLGMDGKPAGALKAGDKVWFTYPAKLYKGKELGNLPAAFTYAAVSNKPVNTSIGYVSIAAVTTPSPKLKDRIAQGAEAQLQVVAKAVEMLQSAGHKVYEDKISIAKIGSTAPDIVIPFDGGQVQFEVKGTNNASNPIAVFDKSVHRNKPTPPIVDLFANAFIDALSLKVKDRSFIGLIDYYRASNPAIGLAGDEGVVKSGKLPKELITNDPRVLKFAYDTLLGEFQDSHDDYFAIADRSNNSVTIYATGSNNPLKAPMLPPLTFFGLMTYGGASSGNTRVGLKIKL